jgi:type IV pilus assembly protein PilM
MPVLAVDFGTSLIKVVKTDGENVKSFAMAANPLGKVNFEAVKDVTTIVEVLKKMLAEIKFDGKKVNVVISDSAAYMSVISLPVLSDTELASSLNWEAEQYVPVPLNEVELSWEVLNRPERKTGSEKMNVLLVASSKRLIQGIVDVFTALNLEPESIESELIAVTRSIYPAKDSSVSLVLGTFGASSVSLGVFRQGKLILITKFNSGGLALTRAISQSLQLPLIQAEEYKRTYGVKSGVLENRLLSAMVPVLDGLVEEIRRVQGFFEQQNKGEKLTRLMLSGGSALLPGLLTYLSEKTGLEVFMGDPLQNNKLKNLGSEAVIYAAAVGAAQKK